MTRRVARLLSAVPATLVGASLLALALTLLPLPVGLISNFGASAGSDLEAGMSAPVPLLQQSVQRVSAPVFGTLLMLPPLVAAHAGFRRDRRSSTVAARRGPARRLMLLDHGRLQLEGG